MAKKKATRKTQRRARGGADTGGGGGATGTPVEMIEGGVVISVPSGDPLGFPRKVITIHFGEGPQ